LGRHDEDRRVRVDLHVAGEDADLVLAVGAREVAELLVAERLERRGVGDAPAVLQRLLDGELRHQRLARTRGCGHDHRLIARDRANGLQLEVVQWERIAGAEALDGVHPVHGTTRVTLRPYRSRDISGRPPRLYAARRARRRIGAMATNRALLTAEDYFARPAGDDDQLYELMDGELMVRP